jgi:hypothetical protein
MRVPTRHIGVSSFRATNVGTPPWIPPSVVRTPHRSGVLRYKQDLDDEDESHSDPTNPDESEEGGEDSAGFVDLAGGEVAPSKIEVGRVACALGLGRCVRERNEI